MDANKKANDLLIYGVKYHLWREGKYIGIATWSEDENVGDSFLRQVVSTYGELVNEVYIADQWRIADQS